MKLTTARRVRLLIYTGTPEQIHLQRERDGVRSGGPAKQWGGSKSVAIQSIELSPTRITLRELAQILSLLALVDNLRQWWRTLIQEVTE